MKWFTRSPPHRVRHEFHKSDSGSGCVHDILVLPAAVGFDTCQKNRKTNRGRRNVARSAAA